ncbi:MAG TPA: c(7)-type cytochrome triheme domain-containing protein [Dissulfurispiraceae bacterium]|nr:c(7)-type cytochrome triheme domain-containing protein [Dissulfurispiraceae bacterium]
MKAISVIILIFAVAVMGAVFEGRSIAEDDTVGGGEIVYTKPVKAVLFSHKSHAAMGLDCNACHDKIFQMAALSAESQPDFNMKGLYDKKYCGSCHAKDGMAFASDTQCARCHIGTKGFDKNQKQVKK